MARKKFNSSNYLRSLTGDAWYQYYRDMLELVVHQMFEWKGLPETVDPFYLEKSLHRDGMVGFYDDKKYGKIVVSGAARGLSIYNKPTEFQINMNRYHKQFKIANTVSFLKTAPKGSTGIICYNQFERMKSSNQAIRLFASLLAENKQTKRVSQNALKIPFIFVGKEEHKLAFKNAYDRMIANEPYFIIDEESGLTKDVFQVVTTNAPYLLDKLDDDRLEIMNEFLTSFGIDNVNIAKKERLVVSEAESNNEFVLHNRNKFLAPRKATAEMLSEWWGTEITVDLRENLVLEVETEVDNNGSNNHDDT